MKSMKLMILPMALSLVLSAGAMNPGQASNQQLVVAQSQQSNTNNATAVTTQNNSPKTWTGFFKNEAKFTAVSAACYAFSLLFLVQLASYKPTLRINFSENAQLQSTGDLAKDIMRSAIVNASLGMADMVTMLLDATIKTGVIVLGSPYLGKAVTNFVHESMDPTNKHRIAHLLGFLTTYGLASVVWERINRK